MANCDVTTTRPDYYKNSGLEVIDVIYSYRLGFNLGNVLKYLIRAGRKTSDRLSDLQKALTYVRFEQEPEPPKTIYAHQVTDMVDDPLVQEAILALLNRDVDELANLLEQLLAAGANH